MAIGGHCGARGVDVSHVRKCSKAQRGPLSRNSEGESPAKSLRGAGSYRRGNPDMGAATGGVVPFEPALGVQWKFCCLVYRRALVDYPELDPTCMRCGPRGSVVVVCRRCDRPSPKIAADTLVCGTCTDASDVARTSAGTGETPFGLLSDRPSHARRWRPPAR